MSRQERLLSIIGLVIVAIILAVAFKAYLGPAMLMDFASLQLCS